MQTMLLRRALFCGQLIQLNDPMRKEGKTARLLHILGGAHKTAPLHRVRLSRGSFTPLPFTTLVSLLQTTHLQQSKLASCEDARSVCGLC